MRKKLLFNREDGIPLKELVSSYYSNGGMIQTKDGGLHCLIDEDRKKLNKMLDEFFKTAEFREK